MKRTELEKRLRSMGCEMVRHGGSHDWWHNPQSGTSQPVPRHREIRDVLAKKILRSLSDDYHDPDVSAK